jgi:hypothetical protein
VGLTNVNVTLTPTQFKNDMLTLSGTLTGNVQLIFPAHLQRWLIINNTTGNFSITCKTAAGTGVVVPQAQSVEVYGDGTNIGQTGLGTVTTAGEKLPSLSVVQAAGALTFSSAAQYRDFRSTTLTDGANNSTLYDAPDDTVLPSGGTLGFTSTVEGTIVIAEMNFGGVKEHAFCNKAGGLQTDESNLISTTAVGTGSDSASVWYSTTARTNLPYKIIGEANVINTGGAWGDPTLIQPAGGKATAFQMVTSTAQATTSGTAKDYTELPTWIKGLKAMLRNVSTAGTSNYLLQVGNSAGFVTSGYTSRATTVSAQVSSTAGFVITSGVAAADLLSGDVYISINNDGSISLTGILNDVGLNGLIMSAGELAIGGPIDRLRLTTIDGTQAFDGGSFNIQYWG